MLKDIIQDCLQMLGEEGIRKRFGDIREKSDIESEIAGLSSHEQDIVKLLVSCSLNVLNSVTRNLVKAVTVENVKSDSQGRIFFDGLQKSIISVKDVRDELNSPVIFHVFFDHVRVPFAGKALTISYQFEYEPLSSLFDSYDLPLSITNHIIALGAVSEYLGLKLLYSEAEMFESKFKAELEDAAPKKGERKFKTWRKW